MASIFSDREIDELHHLAKPSAIKAGHIRGPSDQWRIKGPVFCGAYTSINGVFDARGKDRIGKYCAFGRYVALLAGNHKTTMPNQQVWLNQRFGFELPVTSKGPVEIGHNVWIGDKVNVVSGVQVGH